MRHREECKNVTRLTMENVSEMKLTFLVKGGANEKEVFIFVSSLLSMNLNADESRIPLSRGD